MSLWERSVVALESRQPCAWELHAGILLVEFDLKEIVVQPNVVVGHSRWVRDDHRLRMIAPDCLRDGLGPSLVLIVHGVYR